jgi:acetyl esterase/lipase
MALIRRLLILIVGIAFFGALGVALVPFAPRVAEAVAPLVARTVGDLAPSDTPFAAPSASQGRFSIVERPDLRPMLPRQFSYEPPRLSGVTDRTTADRTGARPWQLYVPDSVPTEPRPVVVLLHWANRDGRSMIHMWMQLADAEGVILVGINAPEGAWRLSLLDPSFLDAVLQEVDSLHPVDRGRVFLFGHSAGARMAQVLANRQPDRWRAVAVHAGTVDPSDLRRVTDAPPVRHYLGTEDHIFDVVSATVAGQRAAARGHHHELVLIPGHTHWFYVGGPIFAADAWGWFETH